MVKVSTDIVVPQMSRADFRLMQSIWVRSDQIASSLSSSA